MIGEQEHVVELVFNILTNLSWIQTNDDLSRVQIVLCTVFCVIRLTDLEMTMLGLAKLPRNKNNDRSSLNDLDISSSPPGLQPGVSSYHWLLSQ